MFNYKAPETGLRKIHQIEKRFGFKYATPVERRWPCYIEVLTLMEVDSCGAFAGAGFERGDVFSGSEFQTTDQFFKALDKPAGDTIQFEVIPCNIFEPECDFDPAGKTVRRIVIAP
jgi:hypothetical protein